MSSSQERVILQALKREPIDVGRLVMGRVDFRSSIKLSMEWSR